MVAQSDETEAERASSLALWIAVPVKIVVVDDRLVECRTIGDRDDDDGRRLDHRSRRDGLPREDPATARGADANLDAMVRYRPKVGEHRRDGRPRWAGFRRARADDRRHPPEPPNWPPHRAVALAPAASSRPHPLLSYPP